MADVDPLGLELSAKEQIEIDFWRDDPSERPDVEDLGALLNKASILESFHKRFRHHRARFEGAERVLELGGGQGGAACIVKRELPGTEVILSDISEFAVASLPKWERVFDVKVDRALACKSYEIPFEDASLDVVYAFAAAHHFIAHRKTFREVHRVLRPGGRCLYLHEPICSPMFHKALVARANRHRVVVPEDVLRWKELCALAESVGFSASVESYVTFAGFTKSGLLYKLFAEVFPALTRANGTGDFVFVKR
ncbi:MAG: class I SAM-dependent methyltransferase [Fimbriimonadaceae bacterium]|nr:class I SAM-dependent methyltransferase [Fimbriimonadaceae bacterium]